MGALVDSVGIVEQGIEELRSSSETLGQNIEGIDCRVQVLEVGTSAAVTEAKEVVQQLVNEVADSIRAELALVKESLTTKLQELKEQLESVKGDMILCKVAVVGGATIREGPMLKVPGPSKYHGK